MLKFVGDICFSDGYFDTGFGVGSSIRKGFDPFVGLKRSAEDFWVGNFECVCSDHSDRKGVFANQFRISPNSLKSVKHLDLYSVANNHVMQHGHASYREMLHYLEEQNIPYVGSDEKRTCVVEHSEKRIGIMAFSQRPDNFTPNPLYWSLPEYEDIKREIGTLEDCDYRVAYLHWGNEFIDFPYIDQVQLAHYMIDCGIDLIIGMHPHRLQGVEVYKGKHIFYSLGNCVFNMKWEPTRYSIVVNVDLHQDAPAISWDYLHIGDDYFPRFIENVPEAYCMEHLTEKVNHHIENEKYYSKVFANLNEYRKVNRKDFLMNLYRFKISDLKDILGEFLYR